MNFFLPLDLGCSRLHGRIEFARHVSRSEALAQWHILEVISFCRPNMSRAGRLVDWWNISNQMNRWHKCNVRVSVPPNVTAQSTRVSNQSWHHIPGEPIWVKYRRLPDKTGLIASVCSPANYRFILQGVLQSTTWPWRPLRQIVDIPALAACKCQVLIKDDGGKKVFVSVFLDSPEAPALCGQWGWTRWQSNRNACSRCWREPRPPSGSHGQSGGCRRGQTPGTNGTKSS